MIRTRLPLTILAGLVLVWALFPISVWADSPGTRAHAWWRPDTSDEVRLRIVDAETEHPVATATVYTGSGVRRAADDGEVVLRGTAYPVLIVAPHYLPTTTRPSAQDVVRLQPAGPRLYVEDAVDGTPLAGATVVVNGGWVRTDTNGYAPVPTSVRTPIVVKHGGHRTITLDELPADGRIRLEPFHARGLYLSFNWLDRGRDRVIEVLDQARAAGLNTVVIDAKGDRGFLAFESGHPDAARNEVNGIGEMPLEEFLELARERDFYVIARVVVFKDNPLAFAQPERAVRRADGSVWIDGEELGWANPLLPANWDYNATLARELAEMGFDEINLDYIRFPTDGDIEAIEWERELTPEIRIRTINTFLRRMEAAVRPTPALLSGDVFGLVPVTNVDMGIGQIVEEMAPHLDVFCPMTYPATYWPGNMDVADPLRQPYETVHRATRGAVRRSVAPVRPWLQGYSWAGVDYGPAMLDAQVRGAEDAGAVGWIFWHASGQYQPLFTYLRNAQ